MQISLYFNLLTIEEVFRAALHSCDPIFVSYTVKVFVNAVLNFFDHIFTLVIT